MKKVILLLSLVFAFVLVNAQTEVENVAKSAENVAQSVVNAEVSPNLSQAEKLVDKYSEKITVGITSLAKSLQQPAEKVFEILTYKAFAEGLSWLLAPILTLLLMIGFFRTFKKATFDNYGSPDKAGVLSIIFGIVGLIALVVTMCGWSDMITHLVAPEYYAIKEITEIVSALK